MAIVWKNVLCMRRKMRSGWIALLILMAFPLFLGIVTAIEGGGVANGVAMFSLVVAVLLLLVGPMLLRNDLRHDMLNITALKLLPLRGRMIVTAEVLSVVVPLAVAQCF